MNYFSKISHSQFDLLINSFKTKNVKEKIDISTYFDCNSSKSFFSIVIVKMKISNQTTNNSKRNLRTSNAAIHQNMTYVNLQKRWYLLILMPKRKDRNLFPLSEDVSQPQCRGPLNYESPETRRKVNPNN